MPFGLNYAKLAGIIVALLAIIFMGVTIKIQAAKIESYKSEVASKNVQIQSLGEDVKRQNQAVNEMMDRAKTAQILLEKSQDELQQKQQSLNAALAATKGHSPGTCAKARADVDAILRAMQ